VKVNQFLKITCFGFFVADELAIAVASDCVDHTFYWTDVSGGKISRANLDGFNKELVVKGILIM
jgi:hypothetical protein